MARSLRDELRRTTAVALVVLAVVGLTGTVAVVVVDSAFEEATDNVVPALADTSDVVRSLSEVDSSLRSYVISADERFLTSYRAALAELPGHRARLAVTVRHDPEATRLFEKHDAAIDTWLGAYALPRVDEPVGPSNVDPLRLRAAAELFDAVRITNEDLREHLRERLAELQTRTGQVERITIAAVVLITALAVVGGALASARVSRRVRQPLDQLRVVLGQLTAGQHQVRATPAGPEEVAQIAHSVNALAEESERMRDAEAQKQRLQQRLLALGRDIRTELDDRLVARQGVQALGETLRLHEVRLRLVADGQPDSGLAHWRSPEPTQAGPDLQVPVSVDDETVAQLDLVTDAAHPLDAHEMHFAEAAAGVLARALSQNRLYARQRDAMERLRALDEAKNAFVSGVSHELRTPLTSISGYVELLRRGGVGELDADQQRVVVVLERNVARLRSLIEDLLTLTRIGDGDFGPTLADVDLGQLVAHVVEDITPQAKQQGIELRLDLPGTEVSVCGDETQLSRALLNLASNAVKFTPAGGAVHVSVQLDETNRCVDVQVRDTGIGVPDAEVSQLFQRFFRASNASRRGVPGTGLGLVIVRTIIEQHGGRVELRSTEGAGTTVTVRLPLVVGASPGPHCGSGRSAGGR